MISIDTLGRGAYNAGGHGSLNIARQRRPRRRGERFLLAGVDEEALPRVASTGAAAGCGRLERPVVEVDYEVGESEPSWTGR